MENIFLAWRFVTGIKKGTTRAMIFITFFSIAAGSFSLSLVTAIMRGFETETHKNIQGVNPDLSLILKSTKTSYEKIKDYIEKKLKNKVKSISPYLYQNAICIPNESNDKYNRNSELILVTGIDPESEKLTTKINKAIRSPKEIPFKNILHKDSLIIGESLSSKLGKKIGSRLFLFTIKKPDLKKISIINDSGLLMDQISPKVSGIFKTGFDELDSQTVFCSLESFCRMFPNSKIEQIGLKLTNPKFEKIVKKELESKFNLEATSWKDLYPALTYSLKLEKYAMSLILALLLILSIINVISLLFMFITNKKADIALLKTLGLSDGKIRNIFIQIGFGITLSAALTGVLLATAAGYIITNYLNIQLPEIYFASKLTANLTPSIFIGTLIFTVTVGLIASIISTSYLKKIKPISIIKHIS